MYDDIARLKIENVTQYRMESDLIDWSSKKREKALPDPVVANHNMPKMQKNTNETYGLSIQKLGAGHNRA